MFLWCQIDRLLQFSRSLEFRPNSYPYTQDYLNTLLFETQEKVNEFSKNFKFYWRSNVNDFTGLIYSY